MSALPDPYVDPDTARVLAAARAAPAPDYAAMPIAEARAAFADFNRGWNRPVPELREVRDLSIPGGGGEIFGRLHRPSLATGQPLVLYLHGGGWTFGSVDSHDRMMRLLAVESGCAVLGIDYRLAPEYPFPAGLEDALATLVWLARGGLEPAVDPSRIALAGDSAGANLALAALIMQADVLRSLPLAAQADARRTMPRTAALFYGCFAPEFDTASHRRFGDGYILTTQRMRWFWRNYLGPLPAGTGELAAPSRGALAGLPPLFLNAAGLDPLLDDTLGLARLLAYAGVPYQLDLVPGVVHGFLQQTREVAAARAALTRAARYLATALA
jgi:acetyl esterase